MKLALRRAPATREVPIYDAIETYLTERRIDGLADATTIPFYRFVLADFAGILPRETSTREINLSDIRAWLSAVFDRGCGRNTINKYYTIVNTWLDWLEGNGWLEVNPLAGLKKPRKAKTLPRFFSEIDLDRLMAHCGGGFNGVRLRTIIVTFLGTGMRVSELCALRVRDYDRGAERIRIHGKGDKDRNIPADELMLPALHNWLRVRERYLRHQPYEPLFITLTRRAPTRNGIYKQIQNAGRRAGISPLSPHMLRHSYATIYMANGGSLKALQGILGHANIATTERYIHASADLLRDDMRKASPLRNVTQLSFDFQLNLRAVLKPKPIGGKV